VNGKLLNRSRKFEKKILILLMKFDWKKFPENTLSRDPKYNYLEKCWK
jgi:hypothetical protein